MNDKVAGCPRSFGSEWTGRGCVAGVSNECVVDSFLREGYRSTCNVNCFGTSAALVRTTPLPHAAAVQPVGSVAAGATAAAKATTARIELKKILWHVEFDLERD